MPISPVAPRLWREEPTLFFGNFFIIILSPEVDRSYILKSPPSPYILTEVAVGNTVKMIFLSIACSRLREMTISNLQNMKAPDFLSWPPGIRVNNFGVVSGEHVTKKTSLISSIFKASAKDYCRYRGNF
jgi:hypothetical protein